MSTPAFELTKKREVLWPITVNVPVDGGTEPHTIKINFRLLTKPEGARLARLSFEDQEEKTLDYITNWEGVLDMEDKPVPFTRENLSALLEHEYIARAIAIGWREASAGLPAGTL